MSIEEKFEELDERLAHLERKAMASELVVVAVLKRLIVAGEAGVLAFDEIDLFEDLEASGEEMDRLLGDPTEIPPPLPISSDAIELVNRALFQLRVTPQADNPVLRAIEEGAARLDPTVGRITPRKV